MVNAGIAARAYTRFALLATVILTACDKPSPQATVAVVPFEGIHVGVSTVALDAGADSLVQPNGALLSGDQITVVDQGRPAVRVFRRGDGTLLRTIGTPGDGQGHVRRPSAIVAIDSGQFVVLDQGRRVLSFRDSAGGVLREHRVILAGETTPAVADARGLDLHEVNHLGKRVTSYAETTKPESQWHARFKSLYGTSVGATVITGTLSSNRLRFYDRETGRTRWISVADGWYGPIDWPSDRELRSAKTPESAAQQITAWGRKQRLMNGVFPLDGGRVLTRFLAFSETGERQYHYAIADTTGRTHLVTKATRAFVVGTAGDTLYWLARRQSGGMELGTGIATLQLATRTAPRAIAKK
jgi:hypothetical protein